MINVEEHIIIITITRNFQLVSGIITHPSYRSGARVTFASSFFKGMAAVLPCPRSLGNSVALIGSGLRPADFFRRGASFQPPCTPRNPLGGGGVFHSIVAIATHILFFLLFRVRLRLFFLHAVVLVVWMSGCVWGPLSPSGYQSGFLCFRGAPRTPSRCAIAHLVCSTCNNLDPFFIYELPLFIDV